MCASNKHLHQKKLSSAYTPLTSFKLCTLAMALLCAQPSLADEDFFSAVELGPTEAQTRQENAAPNETSEDNSATNNEHFQFRGFVQEKLKYGLNAPVALPSGSASGNANGDNPALHVAGFDRTRAGLYQVQTDAFAELSGDINTLWRYRLSLKAELGLLQWRAFEQSPSEQTQETNVEKSSERHWQQNNARVFLKDAFVDAYFENGHWLRIGHQLFAWGESESLSITDVLAPTDQREFGQAELQDIREQIPAILYSVPVELAELSGKLSTVLSYRAGHNRFADRGEPFYPYVNLPDALAIEEFEPSNQWEYALRYEQQLRGADIRFVAAEVNDNDFSLDLLAPDEATPTASLALTQARVKMLGASANKVYGSWLLKSELGAFWGQSLQYGAQSLDTDQLRGMLGLNYSGIEDWRFGYELSAIDIRHARLSTDTEVSTSSEIGTSSEIETGYQAPGQMLHISYSSLNQRLNQNLWLIKLQQDQGEIIRWALDYDYSDNLTLSLSYVGFSADSDHVDTRGTTALLSPYRNNDTVNLATKYSF